MLTRYSYMYALKVCKHAFLYCTQNQLKAESWTVIYRWRRQPYFSLVKLDLKQGISSEYIMVDFICIGLRDLWGVRTENYKMKNSNPKWNSNPEPSVYEAKSLSVALLDEISIEQF